MIKLPDVILNTGYTTPSHEYKKDALLYIRNLFPSLCFKLDCRYRFVVVIEGNGIILIDNKLKQVEYINTDKQINLKENYTYHSTTYEPQNIYLSLWYLHTRMLNQKKNLQELTTHIQEYLQTIDINLLIANYSNLLYTFAKIYNSTQDSSLEMILEELRNLNLMSGDGPIKFPSEFQLPSPKSIDINSVYVMPTIMESSTYLEYISELYPGMLYTNKTGIMTVCISYSPENELHLHSTINDFIKIYNLEAMLDLFINKSKSRLCACYFKFAYYNIDEKTDHLTIEEAMNDIKLNKVKFVADSHANMFICDNYKKEIERYEPHGYKATETNVYVDDKLKKYITKLGYKYISPKNISPDLSLQGYHDKINKEAGYCSIWSCWYLDTRLLNLEYDSKKLHDRMLAHFNTDLDKIHKTVHTYWATLKKYIELRKNMEPYEALDKLRIYT